MMMQQPQQQQQQQYSASQSQPTTIAEEEEEEEEEVRCRMLWIGDLQHWMDEAYIDQCFVVYTGEIFPSKVIHNKKTGKSKCYGFIEFNSHAIAERALHQFNGKPMPSVVGSNFELNWASSVVGSNFKLNWAASSFGLGLGLGLGGEKKKKKKKKKKKQQQQQRREADFTISNRYDCIADSDVTDYMLQQQQPTLNIKGARKRCGADCEYCLDRKLLLDIPDTNKKTEVVDPRFPKDMAKPGSNANWVYMLKWFFSLSDGTRPAFNLSKKKWYMETMQSETDYVPNVAERVNIIGRYFTFGEDDGLDDLNVTSADLEDMLDELQRYVESIDVANELYSSGCLVPLLNYLYDIHAGVRAKVAELVTAMVKNNPSGQQLVIEVNGLPPLLYNFTSDPDATSRTKALGAISSLIRNNKPGITAFRLANGYAALKDALSSKSVRIQREALNLIQYLLHENSSNCNIVTELGFPRIMMHLTSSDDAEVREAALGGLLVLASAAREERQLVDSLWNACLYLCCWVRMNLRLMLPASYLNHH